MRISGFSMGRNVSKLYYPIRESIMSALPLVDEFVFALGKGEEDDNTRELIESIGSPKIRIIDTEWDLEAYPRGMEHAHQTDIAREACGGDWLLYLQADEVLHEEDHPQIRRRCEELLNKPDVEGLLFDYLHFWGDYEHYQKSHGWYKHEIRIVRNDPDIHSFESAQSFRRIPNFDGRSYRKHEGTHKLKVARAGARIFHYGWVRPPHYMKTKIRHLNTNHRGSAEANRLDATTLPEFDYGPLDRLAVFKDTHPAVMRDKIASFDWGDKLQQSGKPNPMRAPHKHEKTKYRIVTALEQMLGGREIGGHKNYELLDES